MNPSSAHFLNTLQFPRCSEYKKIPMQKHRGPSVPLFPKPEQCRQWRQGISHGLKTVPRTVFLTPFRSQKQKKKDIRRDVFLFGDPYGNRTHVTAVKGRCLNRLTNGPGSGDLTRTGDRPGMNRVLDQLSYAAIIQGISEPPKSASLL